MKTTKARAATTRNKQHNTKRTGSDNPKRARLAEPSKPTVNAGSARTDSKLATIIKLLSRDEGATLAQLTDATGWQTHSVRGVMSGALGKKRGLTITSVKTDGVRVYRIADQVEG